MTEFAVIFQYNIDPDSSHTGKDPDDTEYEELATKTAELFDKVFRDFFMDIEEVIFLQVDELPIIEVQETYLVKFTIGAYFDSTASVPSESQLMDICRLSLYEESDKYDFYLNLLNTMNQDSVFKDISSVEMHTTSITSHLTGPSELPPTIKRMPRNSNHVLKIIIPIILLVVLSIVAALLCMSWVEGEELFEDDSNQLHDKVTEYYKDVATKQSSHVEDETGDDTTYDDVCTEDDDDEDDRSISEEGSYLQTNTNSTGLFTSNHDMYASPVVQQKPVITKRAWGRDKWEAIPISDDIEPSLPHAKVEGIYETPKKDSQATEDVSESELISEFTEVLKSAPIEEDKISSLLDTPQPDRPALHRSAEKHIDAAAEVEAPSLIDLDNATEPPSQETNEQQLKEVKLEDIDFSEQGSVDGSPAQISGKPSVTSSAENVQALQTAREFLQVEFESKDEESVDNLLEDIGTEPASGQALASPEKAPSEECGKKDPPGREKYSTVPLSWASSSYQENIINQAPKQSETVETNEPSKLPASEKAEAPIEEKSVKNDEPEKGKATDMRGGSLRDFWEQKAKMNSSSHP